MTGPSTGAPPGARPARAPVRCAGRTVSSAGRAPPLQGGGRGFEPLTVHHPARFRTPDTDQLSGREYLGVMAREQAVLGAGIVVVSEPGVGADPWDFSWRDLLVQIRWAAHRYGFDEFMRVEIESALGEIVSRRRADLVAMSPAARSQWIRVTAVNVRRNLVRSADAQERLARDPSMRVVEAHEPARHVEAALEVETVLRPLSQHDTLILLATSAGYSAPELAVLFGSSAQAVRHRLVRARSRAAEERRRKFGTDAA